MIVAQRLQGTSPVILNPYSRTLAYAPTAAYVDAARASMDTPNLEVRRLNGLGDGMSDVPSWVWWGLGGIAAGVAVGLGVRAYRKRK